MEPIAASVTYIAYLNPKENSRPTDQLSRRHFRNFDNLLNRECVKFDQREDYFLEVVPHHLAEQYLDKQAMKPKKDFYYRLVPGGLDGLMLMAKNRLESRLSCQ